MSTEPMVKASVPIISLLLPRTTTPTFAPIYCNVSISPGLHDPMVSMGGNFKRAISNYLTETAIYNTKLNNPQLGDLISIEGIKALQHAYNRDGSLLMDFCVQEVNSNDLSGALRIIPYSAIARDALKEATLVTCPYPPPSLEWVAFTTRNAVAPDTSLAISTSSYPSNQAAEEIIRAFGSLYIEGYDESMTAITPDLTADPNVRPCLMLRDKLGRYHRYDPRDPATVPTDPYQYLYSSTGGSLEDAAASGTLFSGHILLGIANNSSKLGVLLGVLITDQQPMITTLASRISISIPGLTYCTSDDGPAHTFNGNYSFALGNLYDEPVWESSVMGGCLTAVAIMATLEGTSISTFRGDRTMDTAATAFPDSADKAKLAVITPQSQGNQQVLAPKALNPVSRSWLSQRRGGVQPTGPKAQVPVQPQAQVQAPAQAQVKAPMQEYEQVQPGQEQELPQDPTIPPPAS